MSAQLKAEVWSELRAGRDIKEAFIADPTRRQHIHGLCSGKEVIVNPVPSTVDTICHELIHRLHPRWGEKRVWREARRLVRDLSDDEAKKWYRTYQRVARKARTVTVED